MDNRIQINLAHSLMLKFKKVYNGNTRFLSSFFFSIEIMEIFRSYTFFNNDLFKFDNKLKFVSESFFFGEDVALILSICVLLS